MHYINEKIEAGPNYDALLILPFELRQKSRQRAVLDNGDEVGLLLPPGTFLRDGDRLLADDGRLIRVRAAEESVSTGRTNDPLRLARACYHLGNRHVPIQIGAGWVRYLHDHVLDHMILRMGLVVLAEKLPFEPEAGAYETGHEHDSARHTHTHAHEA